MIRLGIIGVGGIVQGAHLPYLKECEGIKLVAICDIDEKRLNYVAEKEGIEQKFVFKSYLDLIKCDSIDAVLVATPHYLHKEMAIAVCKAKKHLLLEKPVAMDKAESEEIYRAVQENGVKCMVCLSYHYYPCFRYAKSLLDGGTLGRIQDMYAQHFKESALWEGRKMEWRFKKELSGHGVLIDLGVHLLDLAEFLASGVDSVCAMTKIAVSKRQKLDSDEYDEVDVDDSCNALALLNCGAHAVFSISRCAIGNPNKVSIEIYGEKGVIRLDSTKPDEIVINTDKAGKKELGDRVVKVGKEFYYNQMQAFVDYLRDKVDEYLPTIEKGLATQKVIDAIAKSAKTKKFEKVK